MAINDLNIIDGLATRARRDGTDLYLEVTQGPDVLKSEKYINAGSITPEEVPALLQDVLLEVIRRDGATSVLLSDPNGPSIIGPTSVRGIGNRSGWPNQFTGGLLLSGTIVENISKSVVRTKLLFANAAQYIETLGGGGASIQGVINCPIGSNNYYTVTFDGGNVNGALPNTGAVRLYESDWVDFPWPKGVKAMLYLSSIGGSVPTMGANQGTAEWSIQSRGLNEFQTQSNATVPVAGMLDTLTRSQMRLLSSPLPFARIVSDAVFNSTFVDFRIYNHGLSSGGSTNKILAEGWTNSGVAINGLWSYTAQGSHDIRITMGDPGTITERGVFRVVPVPATMSYSAGKITVGRTGHGLLQGDVVCMRGVVTGVGTVNYDFTITDVTTDSYSFEWAGADPVSFTLTNAYYYPKYPGGTAYHFRPVAFLGESDVECTGIVSDSTSSTVDFITDPYTLVQGVGERCVGEAIPFINISATNDGLYNWFVNSVNSHQNRQEILRRYTQTLTFGFQKNDENNYNGTTVDNWITNYNLFWAIPDFAAHKATGKNKLILTATRNTSTRNRWSTKDGQQVTNTTGSVALAAFQKAALADMGTIYNKLFDLNVAYCEPGLPGVYLTSKRARNIIVTTTNGSSLVTVDASTPISIEDNGEVIALVGAESTGNTCQFGTIKYINPTQFYFMGAGSARNKARTTGTNALTNGVGIIGAHYSVQQSTGTTDVVHESTTILQNISNTIALKRK